MNPGTGAHPHPLAIYGRAMATTTTPHPATAFDGQKAAEPLTGAQIEGIARDLLDQFSLDEKIDMMSGGRALHLAVPASDLAYYGDYGWVVEPGEYEVFVGRHSLDEQALRAGVVIA